MPIFSVLLFEILSAAAVVATDQRVLQMLWRGRRQAVQRVIVETVKEMCLGLLCLNRSRSS